MDPAPHFWGVHIVLCTDIVPQKGENVKLDDLAGVPISVEISPELALQRAQNRVKVAREARAEAGSKT